MTGACLVTLSLPHPVTIIASMPLVAGELDSRIAIVTPENIAFHYRLAGPFRRLIAYGIDLGLRILVTVGLFILLAFSGALGTGVGIGLLLVAWFIISWFYGGLFETFWSGQTPGKWLMRLRVLTHDGQPINALQAVLRNILRAVDAMPVVPLPWLEGAMHIPIYSLGLVTMAMTDRYQRWGDLACGTMVVVEDRRLLRGVIQMDDAAVREMAGALPANYMPSPSLARAISAYVDAVATSVRADEPRLPASSASPCVSVSDCRGTPATISCCVPCITTRSSSNAASVNRGLRQPRRSVPRQRHPGPPRPRARRSGHEGLATIGLAARKLARTRIALQPSWRPQVSKNIPRRAVAVRGFVSRGLCRPALADAYQLPPGTVQYLHDLVGRAHNQLYRSQRFNFREWGHDLFQVLPARLCHDRALWLAFTLFWGVFLISMGLAWASRDFTDQVVGEEALAHMEESFSKPIEGRSADESSLMVGFYIWHNTGIGLECFAAGLLLGVGGLFATVSNAAILGAVFGHMLNVPQTPIFIIL